MLNQKQNIQQHMKTQLIDLSVKVKRKSKEQAQINTLKMQCKTKDEVDKYHATHCSIDMDLKVKQN